MAEFRGLVVLPNVPPPVGSDGPPPPYDDGPVDAGPVELVYSVDVERTSQEVIDRICAWMRANGADPDRVPGDSAVSVKGSTLTYEEVIEPAAYVDGRHVTRVRTVPLLVAPPDDLLVDSRTALTRARARIESLTVALAEARRASQGVPEALAALTRAVEALQGARRA
jgi:hypothetical protein